jgi:hypothetical protein
MRFYVIDPLIPEDWVRRDYADGEYSVDPLGLGAHGFCEDYFDGVEYAVEIFEAYRNANDLPPRHERGATALPVHDAGLDTQIACLLRQRLSE